MKSADRQALIAFVDAHVTSFEVWDVLMYVFAHPDADVSPSDLARDIGRRPAELAGAAEELCVSGVLESAREGYWRLARADDVRRGLGLFADAVHDPQERLSVLTRLLENLSD